MHLSFAIFADAANLSQEGKLNILGVFDAVQVATLPAMHPRAHLVVRLTGDRTDAGSHTLGLRWVNPAGQELWSSVGALEVGPPPGPVGQMELPVIAAVDLPLDRPGAYRMEVSLDGQLRSEVALHVRTAAAPPRPVGGLVS